jgi:hypothetical protein
VQLASPKQSALADSDLIGKRDEASAIVAVVNATKPVGHRNADRASAMRRQHSALIVHEEPTL